MTLNLAHDNGTVRAHRSAPQPQGLVRLLGWMRESIQRFDKASEGKDGGDLKNCIHDWRRKERIYGYRWIWCSWLLLMRKAMLGCLG